MTAKHCQRPGCHHIFLADRRKFYCSKTCAAHVRSRKRYPPRIVRCLVCNRERTVEGVGKPRLLCSRRCRQVNYAMRGYGIKGIPIAIRLMLDLETCQVCGRMFDETNRLSKRNIDHDHETGYFRGIICGNCNLTAGRMKADDFRRLADYLDRTTPAGPMTGYIVKATE